MRLEEHKIRIFEQNRRYNGSFCQTYRLFFQHGHACSEGRCNKERTEGCEENCQTPDGYQCHCKQDDVLKDEYCNPLPGIKEWKISLV